jgi:hypothetical protein
MLREASLSQLRPGVRCSPRTTGKAAILTATSRDDRNSVAGKWIMETLLGTRRTRAHVCMAPGRLSCAFSARECSTIRSNRCVVCHRLTDPIVSFENFDRSGMWRSGRGKPVDSTGQLLLVQRSTPADLRNALLRYSDQTFVEKL